ncbi:hypothetical protein CCACVL1_01560, partial [Corchorus capsularis]
MRQETRKLPTLIVITVVNTNKGLDQVVSGLFQLKQVSGSRPC